MKGNMRVIQDDPYNNTLHATCASLRHVNMFRYES